MTSKDPIYDFDQSGRGLYLLYRQISEGISAGVVSGERHFKAVFPPGTDRVHVASEIMQATRLKTIILTANAGRLEFWNGYRGPHQGLDDTAQETWRASPVQALSSNPYSCAPVITITMKQFESTRSGEEVPEAIRRFAKHVDRQGYSLIILDECGELSEERQRLIVDFIQQSELSVVDISSRHASCLNRGWSSAYAQSVLFDIPVSIAALQGAITPYRHHLWTENIEGGVQNTEESLSQASVKLDAACQILKTEYSAHGPSVRTVVLMDTIALTHIRSDKYLDGIRFLRLLNSPAGDESISPVMLTGSALIFPSHQRHDILSVIQRESERHSWDLQFNVREDEEFTECSATGEHWNSASYGLIVQALVHEGRANCIICSRDILSWGLYQAPFCTLIDLSSAIVQEYVHVPEAVDPVTIKEPELIVNYWDVIALGNNSETEPDWDRFLIKHQNTECCSDEGLIDIGIGIFDTRLPKLNHRILRETSKEWNSEQLQRSKERKHWARSWKDCHTRNVVSESVIITPRNGFPEQIQMEAHLRHTLQEDARLHAERKSGQKLHHTLWIVVAVSLALSSFLVFPWDVGMYLSAAILILLLAKIISKWWSIKKAKPRSTELGRGEFLERISNALFRALVDVVEADNIASDDAVAISHRPDGSVRISERIREGQQSDLYLTALEELFSNHDEHSAYAVCYGLDSSNKSLEKIVSEEDLNKYYIAEYRLPVPELFLQSKAHGEVFRSAWQNYVCRAELVTSKSNIEELPSFQDRYPVSLFRSVCRL
jgi:hypothetical protein